MNEERTVQYWIERYNQRCQGDNCTRVKGCVMNLWDEEKAKDNNLQYDALRMKVLERLAQMTVEVNERIAKVFEEARKESGRAVPEKMPIFSLELYSCSACSRPEIDFGD